MATLFAESYDVYNVVADATSSGVWTAFVGSLSGNTQFTQGQCHLSSTTASSAAFPSSETTIFGSLRLIETGTAAGTNYFALSFMDAATPQVTVRWNTDGSIGLYLGSATGTLIQNFPAVFVRNLWASFQFKVVIGTGTAGSIEIRMNGSPTNIVTATGINTRSSQNNTANGFSYLSVAASPSVDDLYFNSISGNQPTSWPGDLRAIQQIPALATQTFFTHTPMIASQSLSGNALGTYAATPNLTTYMPFNPGASGRLDSVAFYVAATVGTMKITIYDSSGPNGLPGAPLSTVSVANPVGGSQIVAFSTPVIVSAGSLYYIGYNQDMNLNYAYGFNYQNRLVGNTPFASFPATNPTPLTLATNTNVFPNTQLNYTTDNAASVQELVQDGDSSYISTTTVGQDKYSMSPIPSTYSVVAMQHYVMWRKSDAGPRTGQLTLAANGSLDTPLITNGSLPTTTYQFAFKVTELDPTGAPWTPVTVNSSVLGVAVTV